MSLGNELSRARLACPGPIPELMLMRLELVTEVTWKCELDFSSGLVMGWPKGT